MARRRHNLYRFGPAGLARIVIQNYIAEARQRVEDWANNYLRRLREAVANEARMALARAKLAAVYLTMLEQRIPAEYKNIMREARTAHRQAMVGIVQRVV